MSILTKIDSQSSLGSATGERTASGTYLARNYADFLSLCAEMQQLYNPAVQVVFFVDADNLKNVNGSLGHTTGDALIYAIAEIIKDTLPSGSVLLRRGGDEFICYVMLSHTDSLNSLASDLTKNLNRTNSVGDYKLGISCSIGAESTLDQTIDLESLIEHADIAMTWAKRNGKRQLKFYDSKFCGPIQYERSLLTDFEDALSECSLKVHYQPIFDTFNRNVLGAEALIRWEHIFHGTISADLVVSTAARTGKLRDLGEYVLRQSCETALDWPSRLFLSVNFAASDFQHADFAERVLAVISTTGFDPSRLRFEITELEYLVMTEEVLQNFRQIQAAGVQVGVDDFGTGYSSMGSIDEFPADFIKIDRSLIKSCDSRRSCKIFLRAIQNVAQEQNLTLVAEGVETVQELAVVSSVGIELAQGFYYSPALDATKFRRLLQLKEAIQSLKSNVSSSEHSHLND